MAIVSAYTIIRTLSLFHITLAALILKDPKLVADQNIVFLLGQSMQLPTPREFSKPSATTAFIAVLLAFLGLSDLTSLSLSDELAESYWGTQTPVRLAFLFVVTGYTYTFKEGGMLSSKGHAYAPGAGDHLKNSIVFTWGFLELAAWFWVFITLRDERRQRAMRLIEQRKAEHDRL
ncbi:hypothetical protein BU26DRAFT_153164 [Trematosphaeria pertusa]|uniref:Increased loss of mitochondrial DNA protein 1 n=1 Tax=Trematosphaeria pertusa TaxID=390896 RepID=A0A6A6IY71_9PLEO|nr:uncharacterized protein BU26DRAFT_153164 [Trematosphaeria pertusa]KAF2255258.1 hypothetical protein BU26DRAFT_153164 [Trematosphaeria pertusa]